MKIYCTCGRPVNVKIDVYEECKYTAAKLGHTDVFENCMTVEYKGLKEWYIITDKDAEEIEAHIDGSCIDDLHEYLELHFEAGTVITFRNSYVDMFQVR